MTAVTETETRQATYPPIAEAGTVALALVVVGGIIMATYVPRKPPLLVPTLLLVASIAIMGWIVVMMSRLHDFAWLTFWLVYRYALIAYAISAALIEYAFVKDHTRNGPLLVVTLMLIVFATVVPLIIAFTVARYQTTRDI